MSIFPHENISNLQYIHPSMFSFNKSCDIFEALSKCSCCSSHQSTKPRTLDFLEGKYQEKTPEIEQNEACYCRCSHMMIDFCNHRNQVKENEYALLTSMMDNQCVFELPMTNEELEKEKEEFKKDEFINYRQFAECKINDSNMRKYFFVRTRDGEFYVQTDGFYNIMNMEKI